MGIVFSEYGTSLMAVPFFNYLGRTLLSSDNDWPAVEQNLRRARVKKGRITETLGREGAYRRTVGRFYVALVQAVLMFGSEMWVLTPRLEKYLEGFHHQLVQRMAGMVPKRRQDGAWVYTPIGTTLEMVGLEEIRVYIAHRQNTVAHYIATLPIMDLCLASERNPGLRLSRQWWDQPALDIMGIRAGHAAAEGGGG